MNFGHWDEIIHSESDQVKRLEKAKRANLTPASIDFDSQSGVFKGSGKSPYIVTLDDCTCRDYFIRRLPCKHIYRLALELGFIEGNFVTHPNFRNKDSLMQDIESMSNESQELLMELLYRFIYLGSNKLFLCRSCKSDDLFRMGLCTENLENYSEAVEQLHVSDLKRELFSTEDTSAMPKQNSQKKTFLKWMKEKESTDLSFLQDNFVVFEFSDEVVESSRSVYRKLCEKYKKSEDLQKNSSKYSFSWTITIGESSKSHE